MPKGGFFFPSRRGFPNSVNSEHYRDIVEEINSPPQVETRRLKDLVLWSPEQKKNDDRPTISPKAL